MTKRNKVKHLRIVTSSPSGEIISHNGYEIPNWLPMKLWRLLITQYKDVEYRAPRTLKEAVLTRTMEDRLQKLNKVAEESIELSQIRRFKSALMCFWTVFEALNEAAYLKKKYTVRNTHRYEEV